MRFLKNTVRLTQEHSEINQKLREVFLNLTVFLIKALVNYGFSLLAEPNGSLPSSEEWVCSGKRMASKGSGLSCFMRWVSIKQVEEFVMKLFISSDMEGTCGITHWDETDYDKGGRWYDYFREQMTREVAAACAGAREGGADDILVKDAHDSARNIIPTELPRGVRLGREWSGGLYSMVDGLQQGFDALAFTGYHSPA